MRCKNCTINKSQCEECYGITHRFEQNCTCTFGYYDVFNLNNVSSYECVKCPHSKCYSCNDDSGNCLSCKGSPRLVPNCSCPYYRYFDAFIDGLSNSYDCQECSNIRCQKCQRDGFAICDHCFGAQFRNQTDCSCLDGYYDPFVSTTDASTHECLRCNEPRCKKCLTSPTVCTECFGASRNHADFTCLTGFFDVFNFADTSTYDCIICLNEKCLSCVTQID